MWLNLTLILRSFKLDEFRVFSSLCAGVVGSGLAYILFNQDAKDVENNDPREQLSMEGSLTKLRQRCFNKYPLSKTFESSKKNVSIIQRSVREKRFMKFASVEYDGQLYMTPRDFLDAMVIPKPRLRTKRKILSDEEVRNIQNAALYFHTKQNSKSIFRTLQEMGILSYTDYLHLVSVLTKPKRNYLIAFNMFDRDGNGKINKEEYLELNNIIGSILKAKKDFLEEDQQKSSSISVDDVLQRKHSVDTTLQVLFFGKEGNGDLTFENYDVFMSNLLEEILELEFNEFARGHVVISETDFVEALIKFTYSEKTGLKKYVERVLSRSIEQKDISFKDFRDFCRFLNHLQDFKMAMQISDLLQEEISEDNFFRIAKISSGRDLSSHLLHVVFLAFDKNGEGKLDHLDLLSVMKNRQKRLFRGETTNDNWKKFKICVNDELNKALKSN